MKNQVAFFNGPSSARLPKRINSPFVTLVSKEIGDIVRSWKFIILSILILLTFLGSMYVSVTNLRRAVSDINDPGKIFIYLKLLTTSDGSLPTFHVFISFLGPLLGIVMGFDAVNSEQSNGTLIRLLAQPIYRDNILLSKFTAAIIVIAALFLSLTMLMVGAGMCITGVPVSLAEIARIFFFVFFSILYISFWLSLSILLSICFKQPATSALAAIAIWLFFTVFYQMLLQIIVKAFLPDPNNISQDQVNSYNNLLMSLIRFVPSQLYMDATSTLLMPSVRSLGPLSSEQMSGAIPSNLSTRDSLMIVWPQVSGLIAATVACFAGSYYLFMRREIRN